MYIKKAKVNKPFYGTRKILYKRLFLPFYYRVHWILVWIPSIPLWFLPPSPSYCYVGARPPLALSIGEEHRPLPPSLALFSVHFRRRRRRKVTATTTAGRGSDPIRRPLLFPVSRIKREKRFASLLNTVYGISSVSSLTSGSPPLVQQFSFPDCESELDVCVTFPWCSAQCRKSSMNSSEWSQIEEGSYK